MYKFSLFTSAMYVCWLILALCSLCPCPGLCELYPGGIRGWLWYGVHVGLQCSLGIPRWTHHQVHRTDDAVVFRLVAARLLNGLRYHIAYCSHYNVPPACVLKRHLLWFIGVITAYDDRPLVRDNSSSCLPSLSFVRALYLYLHRSNTVWT